MLLLGVAMGLAFCLIRGIDLRHELLRLIAAWRGEGAMFLFVTNGLPPWSLGARGGVPGPLCLLYVLPAMFLAPVRWRWWHWAFIVAYLLASPWWWWKLVRVSNGMPSTALPWTQGACDLVMSIGLVVLVALGTRHRRLALGVLVPSLLSAAGVVTLEWLNARAPQPWHGEAYPMLAAAWHVALASSMLAWAIVGRRAYRPDPTSCGVCEYDLRGVSAAACPECGAPVPGGPVPASTP